MNTLAIVKKVQAELVSLGLPAAEYNITEINGDGAVLTFDHASKTVRAGSAPTISFLESEPVSFLAPAAVSFL